MPIIICVYPLIYICLLLSRTDCWLRLILPDKFEYFKMNLATNDNYAYNLSQTRGMHKYSTCYDECIDYFKNEFTIRWRPELYIFKCDMINPIFSYQILSDANSLMLLIISLLFFVLYFCPGLNYVRFSDLWNCFTERY